jgi:hypothetical protein
MPYVGNTTELTALKMTHDQDLISIVSYLESHSLVTRLMALVMYYEVQTRKTLKATGGGHSNTGIFFKWRRNYKKSVFLSAF